MSREVQKLGLLQGYINARIVPTKKAYCNNQQRIGPEICHLLEITNSTFKGYCSGDINSEAIYCDCITNPSLQTKTLLSCPRLQDEEPTSLHLNGIELTEISIEALDNFTSLQILSIHDNKFTKFALSKKMANLHQLFLYLNPWNCSTCEVQELGQMIQYTLVMENMWSATDKKIAYCATDGPIINPLPTPINIDQAAINQRCPKGQYKTGTCAESNINCTLCTSCSVVQYDAFECDGLVDTICSNCSSHECPDGTYLSSCRVNKTMDDSEHFENMVIINNCSPCSICTGAGHNDDTPINKTDLTSGILLNCTEKADTVCITPPTDPPTNATSPPTDPLTNATSPPTDPPTNATSPPTDPPTNATSPPTDPPTNATSPPTDPPTNATSPPTAPPTNATSPPTAPPSLPNPPPHLPSPPCDFINGTVRCGMINVSQTCVVDFGDDKGNITFTRRNEASLRALSRNVTEWPKLPTTCTTGIINMASLFDDGDPDEDFVFINFNEPIGYWDTSEVQFMQLMFNDASRFNQPIGGWDISKVTDMYSMFQGAKEFNQPIGAWDTSNVKFMSKMFAVAIKFDQPIVDWKTFKVISMYAMFDRASNFNQNISLWDTSEVTNMIFMFSGASSFNQPIGDWKTSKVTNMFQMFFSASRFNQPIGEWKTSKVTDMSSMFNGASNFSQDISTWCVRDLLQPVNFATNSPLLKIIPFLPKFGQTVQSCCGGNESFISSCPTGSYGPTGCVNRHDLGCKVCTNCTGGNNSIVGGCRGIQDTICSNGTLFYTTDANSAGVFIIMSSAAVIAFYAFARLCSMSFSP